MNKKNMRALAVLAVAPLILHVALARADVSSLPLFVSTGATPNVMLLVDNSGSMNNIIWDAAFNPAVTYPDWSRDWDPADSNVFLSDLGNCTGLLTLNHKRGRKGSTDRCLRLPDPVGSSNTRYDGNYLNYLFETYASAGNNDIRTVIPNIVRIETARNVATNFVNTNANLRLGLASFNPPISGNSGPGGRINAACGTATSSLVSSIAALTPEANTPLSETFYEVTRYFRGLSSFYNTGTHTSPIQYRCQRNFVIVVTDGYPTYDRTFPTNDPDDVANASRSLPNWDGLNPAPPQPYSDGDDASGDAERDTLYLDDIAKFAFDIDMRTSGNDSSGVSYNDPLFLKQNLRTYTVGFAISNQMLSDAAHYGDGHYYTAGNDAQLNAALKAAVSDIQTRTSSAASVATNSTRLSTDTLIYQARFSTNDWSGQLLAFPVTANGTAGTQSWDAKNLLPAHNSRNIVTYKPGTGGVSFLWNNLSLTQQLDLNKTPAGLIDVFGQARLNYIRGDETNEANGVLGGLDFRSRTSLLGDIVNSDPVFVGKQDFGFDLLPGAEGTAYTSFRTSVAYQNRTSMLYVGANDGMLHGFSAASGVELFAYVPNAIIPNLTYLTEASKSEDLTNPLLQASGYNQKHRYFVDGSPRVIDAYLSNGSVSNWETVLVGALGAGGRGIFALKVTNPASLGASSAMWEFTSSNDNDLGYTIPQPAMGRMNDGSWAAIVGNGYESDNKLAKLFIINLATGAVIKEISTAVGSAAQPNGLSAPIPVDVNRDRKIDFIYAGDLHGNMWKFDVSSSSTALWDVGFKTGTTPKPLFTACTDASTTTTCYNTRQPITVRPEVGANATGGTFVYFGTGKYFETNDNLVTAGMQVQSFYGIRDLATIGSSSPTPVGSGRSTLLQQSVIATQTVTGTGFSEQVRVTSNNSITDTHKGWYIDLPINGERQVSTPLLRGGRIIFTTLIPSTDACGFGGDSWLMEFDALQGARLTYAPFDVNNDQEFNIGDFVVVTINGQQVQVALSGRKSKEGIIKTPGVITAGEIEYKYASGTTGGIDKTVENAGTAGGRQSWRQIR